MPRQSRQSLAELIKFAIRMIQLAIDNLQTHDERVNVDTRCFCNSIRHFNGGLSQCSKNALGIHAANAMLLQQPLHRRDA